jgi:hypothetical protein
VVWRTTLCWSKKKERSQPSEDGIALFQLMLERRKAVLACRLGLEGIVQRLGKHARRRAPDWPACLLTYGIAASL